MSWMQRQKIAFGEGFEQDLLRYVRASGLETALKGLCGPYGVRRFVIRFSRQRQRIVLGGVESVALVIGGGIPSDADGQRLPELERSLNRLHNNMLGGPTWSYGAVGTVQDADGAMNYAIFFEDDSDSLNLGDLPIPAEGHPLESPEYLELVASLAAQREPIAQRTMAISADWDIWEITDDRLLLIYGDPNAEGNVVNKRCLVLATLAHDSMQWSWQVSEPLADDGPFVWPEFVCDWDSAMELAITTAAGIDASWVMASVVEGQELTLFVAVWDDEGSA